MPDRTRRVLQLCHSYGAPFADVSRQWADLFVGRGWQVTTAYLTGEPSDEVARVSGGDEILFFGFSSREVRGLKLGALAKLRQLQRQRHFSLAVAHRFKPLYTCCLALDVPVIGVHHGFGDYRRLGRRIFARAFASRVALLGVSDAVRDDLRTCLPYWSADRIRTQYNHVVLAALQDDLLAADESRQALGLRHQSYIYGNVGRLHPDKDQTTLIRAFARVQSADALLAIAGSGRLDPSLKALANELGVAQRVVFLGQVPGMSRYFGAFDSFVLTSDHEPFGMVLLEAMAARLPVIASDCGGAKEVVSNREWRFPLGDVDALADRMQRMRALDAGARADLVAAQLADLQERFSLDAARRQFWSQPFVRTWIGSDGTN